MNDTTTTARLLPGLDQITAFTREFITTCPPPVPAWLSLDYSDGKVTITAMAAMMDDIPADAVPGLLRDITGRRLTGDAAPPCGYLFIDGDDDSPVRRVTVASVTGDGCQYSLAAGQVTGTSFPDPAGEALRSAAAMVGIAEWGVPAETAAAALGGDQVTAARLHADLMRMAHG